MGGATRSDSRHFRLQRLADGVYAAIAVDGGAAVCNAGIVDLGNCTMIFDAFLTQQAAADLNAAAERLFGGRVGYVVNSHFHNDHIRGNQAFEGARIVATPKTREWLVENGEEDIRSNARDAPEELEALESGEDEMMQREKEMWLGYFRGLMESFPTLKLKIPDLTFDSSLVFHGTRRTAEVVTYGGGHTKSDSILCLPDDRIAFMGDLLFVKAHPYLGEGDPAELVRTLVKVGALDMKDLVPGHGPVGTPQDLGVMRQYVSDLEEMAGEAVKAGGPEDQAAEKGIPPTYEDWRFRAFFEPNMRYVWRRLSKASC